MANFAQKTVEYNGESRNVLVGGAKLIAPLSSEFISRTNDSGEIKQYKLAVIQITTNSGRTTEMTATINKKNIDALTQAGTSFELGSSYLTTIDMVDDKNNPGKLIPFARMSHLRAANTDASVLSELSDMFGEIANEAPKAAKEFKSIPLVV